jgi:alpha-L-rhamnosidase/Glycosyl hydrolases family 2, sugar binding domain/F5/8 type C domain
MRVRRKAIQHSVLLFVFIAIFAAWATPQQSQDTLLQNFQAPPDSAKPRVWWHWMNGNITKEGIKLDLEWMHRVGIGGFQNFDAALNTPQVVEKRLVYMTPEWKDAFLYATKLADQLGLEEAIAGSPGWSESGAPWVKPSQGMKKFVWTETRIRGGKPFHGTLAKPSSVGGPYQNIPIVDFIALFTGQKAETPPEFYADSSVIAYRATPTDVPMSDLQPKITSSGGTIDPALLEDGDDVKSSSLPAAPVGEKAWVQFEFPKPQTIHGVTLVLNEVRNPFAEAMNDKSTGPELESSDDGTNYKKVASIPADGSISNTISFPKVTAKFFRVAFTTPPPPPKSNSDISFNLPPKTEYKIAELVLHSAPRVNRFEEKAAFATLPDLYAFATPPAAPADSIRKQDIIDLTSKMKPDGTLDWTPPSGTWVVLRMGYSPTGVTNHPASPEGTGLEVDKLNPDYVRAYMTTYLDNYKSAVGDLMGKRGLQYVISDSWEAGTQNWTDNLPAEFKKRRGYDMQPWLPVLTGRVVESSEASDRFLWDFRRTLSDLLAEYHYDLLGTILKERNMGHYGESHEEGRAFIGDGMEAKRRNDVPMSAMWTQLPGVNAEQYGYDADIRESASVAHIYGQNLVAAESLTAGSGAWSWSPETLKPTADKELSMGLNRFVIHTSVHQPRTDKGPGLGLGPFGQWFTRNETWAEPAKAWVIYLSRCSYLLQQGQFVADIVYFYGEDSNLTSQFLHKAPQIPSSYSFDYINADALTHVLTFDGTNLATPSGMKYRVLALDPYSQHMSLPVLRKIRDLVAAGATAVGQKPTSTPSLADDANEFRKISDELWGSATGEHSYKKGKVFNSGNISAALTALHVTPDFEYTKPESDAELLFVHRKLADGDLYFINNRRDRLETLQVTLRVQGKDPEIWHPDTGATEQVPFISADNRTTVPLSLEPWGTTFVVLRRPTSESSRKQPQVTDKSVATVDGPWEVAFQENRGAPAKLTLDKLADWSTNSDEGVKYFSGTAIYTKTLQIDSSWLQQNSKLYLDLGNVKNIAEVSINGQPLGILWKTPFRIDITKAAKPGANTLELKITNLWVNRMIGDRQPTAKKQYTFTNPVFYKVDSPLLPSGLIGPVQVFQSRAD